MSQVAVEKISEKKSLTGSIFEEMKSLSDRIRDRAFELFERRGGANGFALDDWLKAEQDFLQIPKSELIENDGQFKATLAAPGLEPKEIKVTALPDAVIVSASSTHKHEKSEGNVCFCEFNEQNLFRRFDLPAPINVDAVTANLEKGVLTVMAPKAAAGESSPKVRQFAA